jgi:hypothetical protein
MHNSSGYYGYMNSAQQPTTPREMKIAAEGRPFSYRQHGQTWTQVQFANGYNRGCSEWWLGNISLLRQMYKY